MNHTHVLKYIIQLTEPVALEQIEVSWTRSTPLGGEEARAALAAPTTAADIHQARPKRSARGAAEEEAAACPPRVAARIDQ